MSDFLFARPSFAEGFARNLDFFGALNVYNTSDSAEEADLKAFRNDVSALKDDFDSSIRVVDENNGYKY